MEKLKRSERRKAINRPKRSVKFSLENNKTRVFKSTDAVVQTEVVGGDESGGSVLNDMPKSAERNEPCTPGRLVKFESFDAEKDEADEGFAD